jgi:hypothetical protein
LCLQRRVARRREVDSTQQILIFASPEIVTLKIRSDQGTIALSSNPRSCLLYLDVRPMP